MNDRCQHVPWCDCNNCNRPVRWTSQDHLYGALEQRVRENDISERRYRSEREMIEDHFSKLRKGETQQKEVYKTMLKKARALLYNQNMIDSDSSIEKFLEETREVGYPDGFYEG